jgi:hypothetical protein
MPLPPEHYEPAVVLPDVKKLNKKTEKSTVAGGAAPAGYFETLVNEGPRVAQQVASTVGKAIVSAVNPMHYKDNGDVDLEATALHGLGDVYAAYRLNKAITPNPLAGQVAATLKVANIEAQTAAAQRAHDKEILAAKQAHEIELQKLKAAGVPAQTAAPVATALTTTAPNAQAQAITLAEFNAAKAATAPPAGTPLNPVPSPLNPTVPLNTEVGKEPVGMGLVEAGKQNTLSNEMAETRKQAEIGSVSDGMRNQYNKNTSKNPNGPNPKGPGAYNWIAGQEGPKAPEVWKNLVGNKNISYDELQKNVLPLYEAYLGSYGEPDPFAQVAKPGSYKKPARIPENIKGNASVKGMASLAAFATALGLGASEKGQTAMAKAANAIKDIGFSPDILTNKAEEMGRLGTGYVTAGNPVYRKELEQKLQSTNDPQYKKVLQEELAKISSSSNSPYRSVPPPR